MAYKPDIRVGIDWDGDGVITFNTGGGLSPSLSENSIYQNTLIRGLQSDMADNATIRATTSDEVGTITSSIKLGNQRGNDEALMFHMFKKDTFQHLPYLTPMFDGVDLDGELHTETSDVSSEPNEYGNQVLTVNETVPNPTPNYYLADSTVAIGIDDDSNTQGFSVTSGETYVVGFWFKYKLNGNLHIRDAGITRIDLEIAMRATSDNSVNESTQHRPILENVDFFPEDTWLLFVASMDANASEEVYTTFKFEIEGVGSIDGTGSVDLKQTGWFMYEVPNEWVLYEEADSPWWDTLTTNGYWYPNKSYSLVEADDTQSYLNVPADTEAKIGFYIYADSATDLDYICRSYEHGTKNTGDVTGTINVTTTPQLVEITAHEYTSNDYGVIIGFRQPSQSDKTIHIYGLTAYPSDEGYHYLPNSTSQYDDISDDIVGMDWKLGKKGYFEPLAYEGILNIIVDNSSRKYTPKNTNSVLYPNIRKNLKTVVQVKDPSSGEWVNMWVGWTDNFSVVAGLYSSQQATIQCNQGLFRLREGNFSWKPQDDLRIDEVVKTLVYNSGWRTPTTPLQWWLSLSRQLGIDTYLVQESDIWGRIDEGVNTYDLIGEGWNNKTTIDSAIKDCLNAEDAVLWVNREGKLELLNRNNFAYYGVSDHNINADTLTDVQYDYGDDLINSVEVFFTPKEEVQNTEVWRTKEHIYVPKNGQSEPVLLTFEYEEGAEKTIDNLQLGKDEIEVTYYRQQKKRRRKTVQLPKEITGEKNLKNITIKTTTDGQGRTFVSVVNDNNYDVYADIVIYGDVISGGDGISYVFEDFEAMAEYESKHKENIKSKIINSYNHARGLAQLRLIRNAYPDGQFSSITIISEDLSLTQNILDIKLGDILLISESQTSENDLPHMVIGENAKIVNGLIYMDYALVRIPSGGFMRFGDNLSDESTFFV